jgi:hypothetical protein
LYKGKLYSYLIKNFTNICIEEFGTQIFSIKKSYFRTLTNLLSSWIFSLYIDYDFSSDYFFPTNYSNTSIIEDTLIDFCKYNNKITNVNDKIKKVTDHLKKSYEYQLELLNKYKSSALFLNNKSNYIIKKNICYLKEVQFYKFNIEIHFVIKDKRLQNILNNILLPIQIYEKLLCVYTGPSNKLDDYIWSIIFRYQLLSSNNHQLAVLPSILNQMKDDYNLNFECFASSINSTFPNYCSIYYDLERHFGSVGSFFNLTPLKGTFGFNPPYQYDIINIGINKLLKFLDESTEPLKFIITIPIWDNYGRAYMKEHYNNELEKQNIDYGDFEVIKKIKDSTYFREIIMVPKEKFTYIDHNFILYKNKTIQNTYVIVISNYEHNANKLSGYNYETLTN